MLVTVLSKKHCRSCCHLPPIAIVFSLISSSICCHLFRDFPILSCIYSHHLNLSSLPSHPLSCHFSLFKHSTVFLLLITFHFPSYLPQFYRPNPFYFPLDVSLSLSRSLSAQLWISNCTEFFPISFSYVCYFITKSYNNYAKLASTNKADFSPGDGSSPTEAHHDANYINHDDNDDYDDDILALHLVVS